MFVTHKQITTGILCLLFIVYLKISPSVYIFNSFWWHINISIYISYICLCEPVPNRTGERSGLFLAFRRDAKNKPEREVTAEVAYPGLGQARVGTLQVSGRLCEAKPEAKSLVEYRFGRCTIFKYRLGKNSGKKSEKIGYDIYMRYWTFLYGVWAI